MPISARPVADIREARRRNLAALLDRISAAELGRRSDIDAAYLYQMAKGKGRNRRGISDATAAKIEAAAGMEPGALDLPESGRVAETQAPYHIGPDLRLLTRALAIARGALAQPGISISAEGFARITVEIYESLQNGESEQAVGRIVAGMLRAFTRSHEDRVK